MSTVNGSQLRHAMNQVHMKENFEEEMIMNVRTQMADETYRRNSFKKYGISADDSQAIAKLESKLASLESSWRTDEKPYPS